MRKVVMFFAVLGVLGSQFATAAEFASWTDKSPQLLLYMHMNLGATRTHRSTPIFGLSLNREFAFQTTPLQSAMLDPFATPSYAEVGIRRTTSLVDLQFNGERRPSMLLGGMNVSSSSSNNVWQNPWLWVGIGVGALAISCATDHFPCSGSSNHMGGGGGGY